MMTVEMIFFVILYRENAFAFFLTDFEFAV